MKNQSTFSVVILAVVSVFFGEAAHAGDILWTGAAGTDWNTPENWDNGVPGPDDRALFASNASVTAVQDNAIAQLAATSGVFNFDFAAALNVTNTFILDGGASLNLNAELLAVTNPVTSAVLTLGSSQNANTIHVNNGATLCANMIRIGDKGTSSSNVLNISQGATLLVNGASTAVKSFRIGHVKGSRNNEFMCEGTVAHRGAFELGPDDNANSRFTLRRNAFFRNEGNFVVGGYNSNYLSVLIADGATLSIAGPFQINGAHANSTIVISNATLAASNNANDAFASNASGVNQIRIYQDAGSSTRVDIGGNFKLTGTSTPCYFYGGTLTTSHAFLLANGGAGNTLYMLGPDARAICGGDCNIGSYNGTGHGLVMSNGFLMANNMQIGWNSDVQTLTRSPNHPIIAGPAVVIVRNTLKLGGKDGIHGNTLTLDRASITVTNAFTIGATASSNNTLRISGQTASITGKTLTAQNNSVLHYTLPIGGFNNIPVRIASTTNFDASTTFVIDAGDFQKSSGHGWVTLLQAGAITAPLTPENFTLKLHGNQSMTPEVDISSTAIRVKIPSFNRTLLLLK